MNDSNFSQKFEVLRPRTSKGYLIQVVDWEYIKTKISHIRDDPNYFLMFSSASAGAFISSLLYSLTGYFPLSPDGSISPARVISWCFVVFTGIVAGVCFASSKKHGQLKEVKASYVLEQMKLIEARYGAQATEDRDVEIQTMFADDFAEFDKWQNYLNGNVAHSIEIKARSGEYCLKKERNNDPHGGYREIGKTIDLGFRFTGWIYRPSSERGGTGDRLAIEDSSFNGYGFGVVHSSGFVAIERRDAGKSSYISDKIGFNPPRDEWYQFDFFSSKDGRFALYINDSVGKRLAAITALDAKYRQFDRVSVHGGHPFYVDELRIDRN